MSVSYHYNEVDHTQYISFATNNSYPISDSVYVTQVFAFRGTVFFDLLNFRRNFLFKFSPTTLCSGCSIHQGFWRNFLALRPVLAQDLGTLVQSTTALPPAFVGLSMGAPLATLATLLSTQLGGPNDWKPAGVVTFGMPRVANTAFADWFLTTVSAGTGSVGSVGFAYSRDPVN